MMPSGRASGSLATLSMLLALATLRCTRCGQPHEEGTPALGPAVSETSVTSKQAETWGRYPALVRADVISALQAESDLMLEETLTSRFTARVTRSFRGGLPEGSVQHSVIMTGPSMGEQQLPEIANKCLFFALDRILSPGETASKLVGVSVYEVCSETTSKVLEHVAQAPLGWRVKGGRWLSPWAAATEVVEPFPTFESMPVAAIRCGKSGRPGWLVPEQVDFDLQPKPGRATRFELVLYNSTDERVIIPALLARDGRPSWKESLLVQIGEGPIEPLSLAQEPGALSAAKLGPRQTFRYQVDVEPLLVARLGRSENVSANESVSFLLGDRGITGYVYYGGQGASGLDRPP